MAGDDKIALLEPLTTEETTSGSAEGVNNMAFSASSENVPSATDTETPILNKEFLQKALLKADRTSFRMEETAGSIQESSLDSTAGQLQVVPQLNESHFEPETRLIYSAVNRRMNQFELVEQREFRRSPCETFMSYLREFTQSWVMILVLVMIIAWPCFYIYLGLTYLHECNFLIYFPIMFLFMGVSGIAAIVSRIFRNVMRMYPRVFGPDACSFCRYVTYLGVFFFAVVYCVSGLIFLSITGEPTRTPGPSYCATTFYIFIRWNLWVVILLGLLLLFYYSATLWGIKAQPEGARGHLQTGLNDFVVEYQDM